MKHLFRAVLVAVVFAGAAQAEVWMPGVFSDNMVLQREKPVPVWGWADPGEKVTVTFAGQTKTATADKNGKWMVRLDAMKASAKGQTLVVVSNRTTKRKSPVFSNVLVGEVWICSGQSNMEWVVKQSEGADEASQRAKEYSKIRFLTVPRTESAACVRGVNAKWVTCSPKTVGDVSGVAFYFGERLHKDLNVPIGLIVSSWGGSGIRSWMPSESFSQFPHTKKEAALAAKEKPAPAVPPIEKVTVKGRTPSAMFNGMIAPLIPYAMRGVIWYQGESNGLDGMGYRDMTEAMLTSWRNRWGDEAFPFYYVQICTFFWYGTDYHLLDMWEAQTACLKIPHTGMVGTSDISQPWTWHPRNKFDVGNRLALWALAKDYGKKDLVYSGPMKMMVKFKGNTAFVLFEHSAKGLKSLDGKPITGFMLAGKDKVFYNAEAKINGDNIVILTSKEVSTPVAARCGWVQTSESNLGNSAGLPVIPFRTDDWKNVFSAPRLGRWYSNGGTWSVKDGVYSQTDDRTHSKLVSGIRPWKNYTFEVELKKTGGTGSVKVYYRMAEHGFYALGVDWDGSAKAGIKATGGGTQGELVKCEFTSGQWHKVKVVVKDDTAKVFLDGKLVLTHTDKKADAHKAGGVGVGGMKCTAQFRNILLTDESGNVLFGGEPPASPKRFWLGKQMQE